MVFSSLQKLKTSRESNTGEERNALPYPLYL